MGIHFISSRRHKNSATIHMIQADAMLTKYQMNVSGMLLE